MGGQILKFDDSAHRTVDALLPWYLNRTLGDQDAERVEQHLRDCARCRREVEMQQQVRAACTADALAIDPMPSYLRVRARIDHEGTLRRASAWTSDLARSWRRAPAWTKWALALQLAAIVVLAIAIGPPGVSEPAFRTLGAPAASASPAPTIAVVFAPDTTEADLRRIVAGAGARVVDGPTATHAFVLAVPDGATERALAALRSERSVVLAERLH